MYIVEEFAINRVQPKFLSILLTGKFRRGVTERVPLKRIFTSREYSYSAAVYSIILLFANRLSTESNFSVIIRRSRAVITHDMLFLSYVHAPKWAFSRLPQ